MSEPIYKFFTGRFQPDWYQLSKEEEESLIDKLHEALQKLGGKTIIHCNTYWSSDQWMWAASRSFQISRPSRNTWQYFESCTGHDTSRVRTCWALSRKPGTPALGCRQVG